MTSFMCEILCVCAGEVVVDLCGGEHTVAAALLTGRTVYICTADPDRVSHLHEAAAKSAEQVEALPSTVQFYLPKHIQGLARVHPNDATPATPKAPVVVDADEAISTATTTTTTTTSATAATTITSATTAESSSEDEPAPQTRTKRKGSKAGRTPKKAKQ